MGFADYLRMAMGWLSNVPDHSFGCGHALSAYHPGGTAGQAFYPRGNNASAYHAGGSAGQAYQPGGSDQSAYQPGGSTGQKAC